MRLAPLALALLTIPAASPAASPDTGVAGLGVAGLGVEGLSEVPFRAVNAGAGPIACTATIAHWFSFDLGEAGPGRAVEGSFWYDPATGGLFALNAAGRRMAVEMLWCGEAGRAWDTRAVVPLAFRAGAAPGPIAVSCAEAGDGLDCR